MRSRDPPVLSVTAAPPGPNGRLILPGLSSANEYEALRLRRMMENRVRPAALIDVRSIRGDRGCRLATSITIPPRLHAQAHGCILMVSMCKYERHRTTSPEKRALEATKPRTQRTLGCGPVVPWPMHDQHYRRGVVSAGSHDSALVPETPIGLIKKDSTI